MSQNTRKRNHKAVFSCDSEQDRRQNVFHKSRRRPKTQSVRNEDDNRDKLYGSLQLEKPTNSWSCSDQPVSNGCCFMWREQNIPVSFLPGLFPSLHIVLIWETKEDASEWNIIMDRFKQMRCSNEIVP